MFVDKADVIIKAGNGGDGYVSFRHEKFIDKGGPDGGDGGNGGDVVLVASRNQNTLAAFRYQKQLTAERGEGGFKRRRHGKAGKALLVKVPVGTQLVDDKGEILADLIEDGQEIVVARGGKGGFGNAHFVSSTRQAPRIAEKGEHGEGFTATLELKMIADVGLVGLPNAGKSTLLATISNARPEIADYPFTTLTPNLGVVDIDTGNSLLFADIPGLIEGASKGKGLGDEFLRHVERTAIIMHLIDSYNESVSSAYEAIQNELKAYKVNLAKRPQIVVLTKIEGIDEDIVDDKIKELRAVVPARTKIMAISSQSKQGVPDLLYATQKLVNVTRRKEVEKAKQVLPVIRLSEDLSWHVTKEKDGFVVTGRKIEKFAERTDFSSEHGLQRLRDIMKKMGIMRELERKGIEPGQNIIISGQRLQY